MHCRVGVHEHEITWIQYRANTIGGVNANGGEPCWISGVQLLRVKSVDSNTDTGPSAPNRR